MPALAITDTNNLFGALEFSEKAAKDGVQPIIGAAADGRFRRRRRHGRAPLRERLPGCADVVLIAQNETGYRNLMRLASRACLDTGGRRRRICPLPRSPATRKASSR